MSRAAPGWPPNLALGHVGDRDNARLGYPSKTTQEIDQPFLALETVSSLEVHMNLKHRLQDRGSLWISWGQWRDFWEGDEDLEDGQSESEINSCVYNRLANSKITQ